MTMAEDFSVFTNPAEFGSVGAIAGGPSVNMIFDRDYVDERGIASSSPVVLLASASVPAQPVRKTLVIAAGHLGTGTYTIAGVEPDGTGMTRLILELA